MILLLYTLSISSPLLTSLQQLLIALWLLPRCLNAFYTPFLRSFLPSKTLAPSSPIWASSWRWLQLSHFSRVWLFATPWTVGSSQAPRSMGFSGKNTGEGCQALFQGIFLTWGSNLYLLLLLHWQAGFFFSTNAIWEAHDSRSDSKPTVSRVVHVWSVLDIYWDDRCEILMCQFGSNRWFCHVISHSGVSVLEAGPGTSNSPLLLCVQWMPPNSGWHTLCLVNDSEV